MASPYQTQILAQIRYGKRSWSYAEIAADFDAFRTEVVEPLRQLKDAGQIQAISEIESPVRGKTQVIAVHISGPIINGHDDASDW
jgi:hypothetical protein